MIKIDLITGFLGSGKTTFIKKYAAFLKEQGEKIGILENDYGAINVDMLLLNELRDENCELEMVAGGCDSDCHKRRFKTKLISMAMCGYTRVIVEPSGIFDVDEFFDVLHEEPLDQWYEVGSVIAIVDANFDDELSDFAKYLFASEVSSAGCIVLSKLTDDNIKNADFLKKEIEDTLKYVKCNRVLTDSNFLIKKWDELASQDFNFIKEIGYYNASYEKKYEQATQLYNSIYFMNSGLDKEKVENFANKLLANSEFGNVLRVKGYVKQDNDLWYEINATKKELSSTVTSVGQEVIIVIGEALCEDKIKACMDTI